jgi:replicative DNA helicase
MNPKLIGDVVDNSESLLFGIAQEGISTAFVHIKDLLKRCL